MSCQLDVGIGPASSLRSAGARSASPVAPFGDRLQVESFIQELLLLGLCECGQSIFVCEPISGCGGPRAEDD
jgi:hypothetical protein